MQSFHSFCDFLLHFFCNPFPFRKTDLILRHFRDASAPGTIAPNLKVQHRNFKKIFSGITTTEILTFKDKDGNDIKRPFSYINDPTEFKTSIASIRKKDIKRLGTKYGLDNGQVIAKIYNL